MTNTNIAKAFEDFKERFKLFIGQHPELIINTLSNIFSMRIIGNKTHGDLAEVGISEFINQFMYDFESQHVGKDLFRKKSHEEDILVKSLIGTYRGIGIPISLKAYGDGPLQLSTDKDQTLFNFLKTRGKRINDKEEINKVFSSSAFSSLYSINTVPLIYDEKKNRCTISVFDIHKAWENTTQILFIDKNQRFNKDKQVITVASGRTHPIYLFLNQQGEYICEVRYGGASANALQRGFWTHTKNALPYFDSLTNGWIDYSQNKTLVELIGLALNASPIGHKKANQILQTNISELKKQYGL